MLLVLALGGQQVIDGTLSYGDLSAFLLYSTFTGFAAGSVASAYAELRRATGASERVLREYTLVLGSERRIRGQSACATTKTCNADPLLALRVPPT